MCATRSLPLARKPLSTLHCFDQSYRVPVFLDEPLWGEGRGCGLLTSNMLALCLQLDAVVMTSYLHQNEEGSERGRKVTFQQRLPARVSGLLDQMSDCLAEDGSSDLDLEGYVRERGLGLLFPRVELCLQEPDQDLAGVETALMDSYLAKLSQLHMVVTLAQQLSSDVQICSSHKYIAHQTALLYQCVGQTSAFTEIKKNIEKHFSAVKEACSCDHTHIPRLTPELQNWLVGVCRQLQDGATSITSQALISFQSITAILK